ncbi:hypothetical protein C4578_00580 [Candidatus Microgenomates bacterium]|jgi:4-amino-4-deoxy-L-arabinose transferase-like glycosyltransferase|nr:MAG: hypothetical protein C4578_00580 [Candidatus Microgenomates bacterium]
MRSFLNIKKKKLPDLIFFTFLIFVFGFALFIRIWKLTETPSVINGDEQGSLVHPWQIILGQLKPFDLTHDGSIPAIVYYPKALFVVLLGIENSLLAARLVSVIFSMGALILFYLILLKEFSRWTSAVATLFFASSYWLLNFSRLSWISVDGLFWGLFFYFLQQKALLSGQLRYYALSGFVASLVAANYMGTRIYLLAGIFLLITQVFKKKKKALYNFLIFILVFVLSSLPLINSVIKSKEKFLLRANTLSVFNISSDYYGIRPADFSKILSHQVIYTFRGFALFDGRVSGEGFENKRLIPLGKSAVSPAIIILYYVGLALAIKRKRSSFWLFILVINFLLVQVLSVYIPAWARGIGVLPSIYYFVACGLEEILVIVKKKGLTFFVFGLLVLFIVIPYGDFQTYWQWVKSEEFVQFQEPAVKMIEYEDWQKLQWRWMSGARHPFTHYQWQDKSFREYLEDQQSF